MTEEQLKKLKLNEQVTDGNGNRYIRVPCGWIFTTFAGQCCFIPECDSSFENSVVKKSKETKVQTK